MSCMCILSIGQEESEHISFSSFDIRTGVAFNLGDFEPSLSFGLSFQKQYHDKWLYSLELYRHQTEAFKQTFFDAPSKDIVWNINAMTGRRFLMGKETLCKLSVSAGVGFQIARRFYSGNNFHQYSSTFFGLAFPVRADLTWSRNKLGRGFYFYGNINTDTNQYGVGIIMPIFTKVK